MAFLRAVYIKRCSRSVPELCRSEDGLFQSCMGQKILLDCTRAVQVNRLFKNCIGQKMIPVCTTAVQVKRWLVPQLCRSNDMYFRHVSGCASLNKWKSQAKAVEVTVKKTLKTFVWISSTNSASGLKILLACTRTMQVKRYSQRVLKLCGPRDALWYVIFRLKADEKLLLEPARQNGTQSRVKKSWGSLLCKTIRQS